MRAIAAQNSALSSAFIPNFEILFADWDACFRRNIKISTNVLQH